MSDLAKELIRPADVDAEAVTLVNCDDEPIHRLGAIQPFGRLVLCHPETLRIEQVSMNVDATHPQGRLGQPLEALIGEANVARVREATADGFDNPILLTMELDGTPYEVFIYETEGSLAIEYEPTPQGHRPPDFFKINGLLQQLKLDGDVATLCRRAATSMRRLVGFDRVMVYRFAPELHGEVIGEDHRDGLESYLGLHYPATDIPAQARALYLQNHCRLIADVNAPPVRLIPALHPHTKRVTDLSSSSIRSVSPIHIEYLQNMGLRASMSISIVQDGHLWGLFACHHYAPFHAPLSLRQTAEFFSNVFAARLAEKEATLERSYQASFRRRQAQMLEEMSNRTDFATAFYEGSPTLLDLIDAPGAAVCFDGQLHTLGETPDADAIRQLVGWLQRHDEREVFHTDALTELWPEGEALRERASGVLALAISQVQGDYLFWFRPEASRMVQWAGNPTKALVNEAGKLRLSPRKSFAAWREEVGGRSRPWTDYEVEAATGFRTVVIGLVLKTAGELKLRADVLARLNDELTRSNDDLDSFAYIASHDLKEPLRGIRNYAQFLLEDYEDQLDKEGRQKLETLVRLGRRMEELISSLLEFSRVGRLDLAVKRCDTNEIVADVLEMLAPRLEERRAVVHLPRPLPTVECDEVRITEVFANLISNGVKYNDQPQPRVEVGYTEVEGSDNPVFFVRDNGIGIEREYHENVFHIFRRLHARDAYDGGTGAGLTIVRKIVERHGGRIWLESQPGRGTTFYFVLNA
ncbi:MAG: ATP-binding protein [Catalinimonas sp.]